MTTWHVFTKGKYQIKLQNVDVSIDEEIYSCEMKRGKKSRSERVDDTAWAEFQTDSHQCDVQGHSLQTGPENQTAAQQSNSPTVVNSVTKVWLAVLKGCSPAAWPGPPEKRVVVCGAD